MRMCEDFLRGIEGMVGRKDSCFARCMSGETFGYAERRRTRDACGCDVAKAKRP